MRWSAEERLRRALPYGMWRWSDDAGVITETLFNRHYRALSTRVDGQLVTPTRDPPTRRMPSDISSATASIPP
jgi:hypothetical protein